MSPSSNPDHIPESDGCPPAVSPETSPDSIEPDSLWEMVMRPKPAASESSSSMASTATAKPTSGEPRGPAKKVDNTGTRPIPDKDNMKSGSTATRTPENMTESTSLGSPRPFDESHDVFSATGGSSDSENSIELIDKRDSFKLLEEPLFHEPESGVGWIPDGLQGYLSPSPRGWEPQGDPLVRIKRQLNDDCDACQVPRTNTGDTHDSGISMGRGELPLSPREELDTYPFDRGSLPPGSPVRKKLPQGPCWVDSYETTCSIRFETAYPKHVYTRKTKADTGPDVPNKKRASADRSAESTQDAGAQSTYHSPPADSDDADPLTYSDEEDADSFSEGTGWMSESTSPSCKIDDTHRLYPVRNSVTQQGLLEYRESQTVPAGNGDSAQQSGFTDFGVAMSAQSSSQGRPKRGRRSGGGGAVDNHEDGDEDGDDDERRPKRPTGHKRQKMGERTFACPFAKRYPSKYRRCYGYTIKEIHYVKQHLLRHHRRPIYCPRCRDIFKSEGELEVHARSELSCAIRDHPVHDGVTMDQVDQLKKRSSVKLSPEDQWLAIFAILFPDDPLPTSAFVEPSLDVELHGFKEFMYQRGPELIKTQLSKHGFEATDSQRSALLESSILDGLRNIANEWHFGFSLGTPSLTSGRTGRSGIEFPEPAPQAAMEPGSTIGAAADTGQDPQAFLDPRLLYIPEYSVPDASFQFRTGMTIHGRTDSEVACGNEGDKGLTNTHVEIHDSSADVEFGFTG